MYRLDRMLTQLHVAGRLQGVRGVILGDFDLGTDPVVNQRLTEQVWARVLELTEEEGIPVWGGFPSGHLGCNHMLPLGLPVTMDGQNAVLRLHA